MRTSIVMAALGAALLANAPARKPSVKAPLHKPVTVLSPADRFLTANARVKGVLNTPSGLQYRVLKAGAGTARPTDSDVALVNYVGKLTDGTVFDQSRQPTPLQIAGVVPGFAESLKLMPKGATYRVWIKPSLGYGDQATGPIPAGAVLVFDIDLIDFISVEQFRQLQSQPQTPGDAAPPQPTATPQP